MPRDDQTVPMFFDGIEDALREVVRSLGGPKPVGARMWPEMEPDKAGRRLADCLNDSRREVLSPSQVLMVLKLGRQANCHAALNYIAREAGYADPTPVEPEDEVARLQREYIEATKALMQIASRIDLMAPQIRRVA